MKALLYMTINLLGQANKKITSLLEPSTADPLSGSEL